MPIYEYQCDQCGHELEKLQKLSDPDPVDCPECGKPGLKRLISAAGFRLKGGGWYETDFKAGKNKRNLVESGDKAKSESKKSDKSEKSDKAGKSKSDSKPKTTTTKSD